MCVWEVVKVKGEGLFVIDYYWFECEVYVLCMVVDCN